METPFASELAATAKMWESQVLSNVDELDGVWAEFLADPANPVLRARADRLLEEQKRCRNALTLSNVAIDILEDMHVAIDALRQFEDIFTERSDAEATTIAMATGAVLATATELGAKIDTIKAFIATRVARPPHELSAE